VCPIRADSHAFDCASVDGEARGQFCQLTAPPSIGMADLEHVLIAQLRPWMRITLHDRRMQSPVSNLVLDILSMCCPPQVADSVVCADSVVMGDFVKS
jgi:hypothetical protein